MIELKVKIPEELWLKFRDTVRKRHGGIKRFMRLAVEEAIRMYISEYGEGDNVESKDKR